jgi:hypothetical protein
MQLVPLRKGGKQHQERIDPHPYLLLLQRGEVLMNRSAYRVKLFYLSSETVPPIE